MLANPGNMGFGMARCLWRQFEKKRLDHLRNTLTLEQANTDAVLIGNGFSAVISEQLAELNIECIG